MDFLYIVFIIVLILAGGFCFGVFMFFITTSGRSRELILLIGMTLICLVTMVLIITDWGSSLNNSARAITVYDSNGNVIEEYNEIFSVDSNNQRIKFKDEYGKQHIIYFSTGTVTVDEN